MARFFEDVNLKAAHVEGVISQSREITASMLDHIRLQCRRTVNDLIEGLQRKNTSSPNKSFVAAWLAYNNVTILAARDAAMDDAMGAAGSASRAAVLAKLQLLSLTDPQEIGTKSYALAELRVLLWLHEHGKKYFNAAFNAAYEKLDGSISIEQAKAIIQQYIGKKKLADNPYIHALQQFLADVEQLVYLQVRAQMLLTMMLNSVTYYLQSSGACFPLI